MQKHLIAASDRYPEEVRKNLVHPISQEDTQVITEIIELFKKMEFTAAVDILQQWKKKSDQDIALELLDLNTHIASEKGKQAVEGKDSKEFKVIDRYAKVCGKRLDLWLLIGYDEVDVDVNGSMKFLIVLNPTPPLCKSVPYYSNEELVFETEDNRKVVLDLFDNYFNTYKGLFVQ